MLSTNDQVAKLQALLARVQANANQPGARLAHRWPGSVWGGPAFDALPLVTSAASEALRPTAPPAAAPVAAKSQAAVAPAPKAPVMPQPVMPQPVMPQPVTPQPAMPTAVVAAPPVASKLASAAKPAVPARPPVPAARPKVPSRIEDAPRSSVASSPTPAPVVETALPLLRSPALSLSEDEATIVAGKGYDEGEASSRHAAILAAVARHAEVNRQSESNLAGSTAATVSAAVSFGAQAGAAEPRAAQLEPIVLKTSLPDEKEVANFIGLAPSTGAETIGDLLAAALSF